MPTLFKPNRPFPLPPDAEIIDRDGKPHARIRERGRSTIYPLSESGKHYLKPALKWAADIRFPDGRRKRVRFSSNRDASAVMLADLLKRIENEKAGVRDLFADHRKQPLSNHVENWKGSLKASGRSDEYLALKIGRVQAAFDGCGFKMTSDLSADRLEAFLHKLRTEDGRSIQTANDWLQACRQFARWMVANGRLERDPFIRLKPGNAKLDTRRRRGEFTPHEIRALLDAAATSEATFRGLNGASRRMLYRVALSTGFRAAELAALRTDSFDLDAITPAAILPAEATKNRRGAVQPIPNDLVDELRPFLRGRPRQEIVWPGTWADRSADMLKIDLDAAAIPAVIDGPEGEEIRDFHALRNCYISNVLRTGADLKQAMTLARHSDPRLTAGRYARTRLFDLGAVVNKLSQTTNPTTDAAALRMTGTDAAAPVSAEHREQQRAATGAATGGLVQGRLRIAENVDPEPTDDPPMQKPLISQGLEDDRGPVTTIEAERAGFEPAVQFDPYAALAKRCADSENPENSSVLSEAGLPGAATGAADSGLSSVIAAWPALPEAIKAAVRALIGAVGK